jgi:hypothetical protein
MGTLFKKKGTKNLQMGVCIDGRQVCKSTGTKNKRLAKKILARWETEVFESKFHLPRSTPPYFEAWADEFLSKILHPSTHKRYASSISKLKVAFTGVRLSDVTAGRIDDFK